MFQKLIDFVTADKTPRELIFLILVFKLLVGPTFLINPAMVDLIRKN